MDQFFRDIYAPIIFKWLSFQKDNSDHIQVTTTYNNEMYQTITFTLFHFKGVMTLWHIGIIEEQIVDTLSNKSLFYLHYRFQNIPHFMKMYREFYQALLKNAQSQTLHIAIVCSGGFTATIFSNLINQTATLSNYYVKSTPLAFYELKTYQENFDLIYFAPQLYHYQFTHTFNQPIHFIDPLIYATKDTYQFIKQLPKKEISI